MTSVNSMHEAGYPKLVHWDNPEGWGGEGVDGGWGCWDTCTLMADSCQCMAKTGEGNGNPLQYSCLGNPMDRGASWAIVHGVTKSQTQLSDFTFTFHFHALEKEMATHSCIECSCIESPREGGAWWAAVYGVAQSRTWLKQLSSSSSSSRSSRT